MFSLSGFPDILLRMKLAVLLGLGLFLLPGLFMVGVGSRNVWRGVASSHWPEATGGGGGVRLGNERRFPLPRERAGILHRRDPVRTDVGVERFFRGRIAAYPLSGGLDRSGSLYNGHRDGFIVFEGGRWALGVGRKSISASGCVPIPPGPFRVTANRMVEHHDAFPGLDESL